MEEIQNIQDNTDTKRATLNKSDNNEVIPNHEDIAHKRFEKCFSRTKDASELPRRTSSGRFDFEAKDDEHAEDGKSSTEYAKKECSSSHQTANRASNVREPKASCFLKRTPNHPSLFSYLKDELHRDYLLGQNEKKLRERRKRVYTFMKTPRELEKFLVFGVLLCLDVFMFIFTFLPLRVLSAIITFCYRLIRRGTRSSLLDPVQKVDIMKALILFICTFSMSYVDTSVVYHIVRVQSVIKLYVIYNMLDVVDKLFASFGQDVLDSLYWTATEPRGRKREHIGILPHLLLSVVYVFLHCLLNLAQAIVLNVAFNSFNKALLTIMVSNQFVEIKGSVFKKFEKNNLFQISCSDARERFHYFLLISIVLMRNLTEFNWNLDHALTLLPDVAVIIGSEYLVDWFKHAFITKFNDIKPDVYETYRAFLAQNIICTKDDMVFTGQTDQVSRRMGFAALPLACLIIRVTSQSVKLNGGFGVLFGVIVYLCLCAAKVLVSIHIYGKAAEYVKQVSPEQIRSQGLSISQPSIHPQDASVQDLQTAFASDFNIAKSSQSEFVQK